MIRSQTYLLSTAAILLLAGCNTDNTTPPSEPTTTQSGNVIDGYVANATVCIDQNSNNRCDDNESTTHTDANGAFRFKTPQSGTILAYGGTDLSTNKPFEGLLKAPAGFENITPLSTLVQAYIAQGKSEADAIAQVAKLFGLDKEAIKQDPIAALKKGHNDLIKANLKLEKSFETLAAKPEDIPTIVGQFAKHLDEASDFDALIAKAVDPEKQKAIESLNHYLDGTDIKEETLDKSTNQLNELKEEAKSLLKSSQIDPDLDDSRFQDTPPNSGKNIPWFTVGETVSDIAAAFNYARSFDTTVQGKKLLLPSQKVWDALDRGERALYVLNRERVDRGLKPFEGVVAMNKALSETKPANPKTLADVAQGYANLLATGTSLRHDLDGTPRERIERVASLSGAIESIPFNENLYNEKNTFRYSAIPLIQALYNWIYADANVYEGEPWAHRAMCLMTVGDDNFGTKGAEGLVAFGLKQVEQSNFYSSYVVLNAINPTTEFSGTYIPTKLNYGLNTLDARFTREKGLIVDTETSLTWQDLNLTQKNPAEAKKYCEALEFGGFDDWRLPTATELSTFYKAAITAGVTPNLSQVNITKMSAEGGFVLTAEGAKKYTKAPGEFVNMFAETSIGDVRCVRGEKQDNAPAENPNTGEGITLNKSAGTATDHTQNLMFVNQAKLAGKMNIEYGKIACNNLDLGGYTDWRLPSPTELSTFHKNAHEEEVGLSYYASYCKYEVTNKGQGNAATAVRVQTEDDKHKIGDTVGFSGGGGIRCVRASGAQDTDVDTTPPAPVTVAYTGSEASSIEKNNEDDTVLMRSYLHIDFNCTAATSCKDVSIKFTGEAGAKLYALKNDGSLPDQPTVTLDQSGSATIEFPDNAQRYSRGINSKADHVYAHLGDYVLVDEAGNVSKINKVFVDFFKKSE